ncbi:hypothetical protein [Streptomyces sp. B29(2018)]|uniref:hypothetical protein n=1 Tax=Streptomyces sp. B29(2018) TaxID=2485016 RepID=UPI000FD622D8|nr:hypothetical protein [Streptomyces sp. B29(2018)]
MDTLTSEDWRSAVAAAARRMSESPSDTEVAALRTALNAAPVTEETAVLLKRVRVRQGDFASMARSLSSAEAERIMGYGSAAPETFTAAVASYRRQLASLRAALIAWRSFGIDPARLDDAAAALKRLKQQVAVYEGYGPTGDLSDQAAEGVRLLRARLELLVRTVAFASLRPDALDLAAARR